MTAEAPTASTTSAPINYFYQDGWPKDEYRFFQVAWVVPDLIAAARRWASVYGVGPFLVLPKRWYQTSYQGTKRDLEMQIAVSQSGPVQIELIQQTSETESVYRYIYPQGSGGLHHFCTMTRHFDRTKAHYESLGYPSITEFHGKLRVEYFDTYKDFGHITELVEYQPEMMAAHQRNAAICAAWDGTDPVRILTRDGYRVPE